MANIKDPANIKIRFGKMACNTCGFEVVVRIKPKTSTLSYCCSGCEDAQYAQPEKRDKYAIWMGKITLENQANNTPLIDTLNQQEKQTKKDMWGNPA